MLKSKKIREEFPIFKRKVHGKPLIYIDNAATTQKPRQVLDAMQQYYEQHNANVHRGVYLLSEEATQAYEQAHEKVAEFINADASRGEVVFTSGTTASINTIAYGVCLDELRQGDEVVITEMEHHSNLIPWQQMCMLKNAKLKVIPMTEQGTMDLEQVKASINSKTRMTAITHMSNVLGTINDIKAIAEIAHDKRTLVSVDAAQSVPHFPVDVKRLDCDFLAFSGHKMCGPTGTGVLYGKEELLKTMRPFQYGGGMIHQVSFEKTTWAELPAKFEAGTPNIAGSIGLGAAIDFLKEQGMDNIAAHERQLTNYALKRLQEVKDLTIYGLKENKDENKKGEGMKGGRRGSVISFNLKGIHAHDVASILDRDGITVRAGHHCAQPLMQKLRTAATARASFYLYNTQEEIDKLVTALENVKKVFH